MAEQQPARKNFSSNGSWVDSFAPLLVSAQFETAAQVLRQTYRRRIAGLLGETKGDGKSRVWVGFQKSFKGEICAALPLSQQPFTY